MPSKASQTKRQLSVRARPPRTIVLFAFDGCQSLDVTGLLEVFSIANRYSGGQPYRPLLVSRTGGEIRTNSGLRINGTIAVAAAPNRVDTLLVVGGSSSGMRPLESDRSFLEWLRGAPLRAHRYGSVCTGAFLLGAAGLLDGRNVTTHWNACRQLAAKFPATRVIADAIFVEDGALYTSGGITAAMDLALALVEADLGRHAALQVARHLVIFLRRSGRQSQFSSMLAAQAHASHRFRDLLRWIAENLTADLSLRALAAHANMSERNFTRYFRKDAGMSPAEFVESVRLDRARLLLQETDWKIARLARECGFGSVDALQRAFLRRLNTTPVAYRRRFAT